MAVSPRKLATLIVSGLTLSAVGYTVYLSLDPEKYFYYRPEDIDLWQWSPLAVAITCAIMVVGGTLLIATIALDRPRQLWLRSLIALLIAGAWTAYSATVLHMPAYAVFHFLWFLGITVVLLIIFVSAAARRLYQSIMTRS